MKKLSEIHNDKKACEAVLRHYAGKAAKLVSAAEEQSTTAEIYGTANGENHYVYLHDSGEIVYQLDGQNVQARELVTPGGVPEWLKKLGYGVL